jgi:hypothetical protein
LRPMATTSFAVWAGSLRIDNKLRMQNGMGQFRFSSLIRTGSAPDYLVVSVKIFSLNIRGKTCASKSERLPAGQVSI